MGPRGASRGSAGYVDDSDRFIDREPHRVVTEADCDSRPWWVGRDEIDLVAVHVFVYLAGRLVVVGPNASRDPVVVVKRDDRRVEQRESAERPATEVLADTALPPADDRLKVAA